ncbi:MAG: aldehyde dehydrogenase family protein [Bacteroidota bacterium]
METISQDIQQEVQRIFALQSSHKLALRQTTAKERKAKLQKIITYIDDPKNLDRLYAAFEKDLKKPKAEVLLSETSILSQHIRFICKHLSRWMHPQKRAGGLANVGTSSHLLAESKGVCLILSPWNYPFQLTLMPLAYAIAAGNAVIVKPSEMAPEVGRFMTEMIDSLFPEKEIAFIEGGIDTAQAMLKLPFNHIYFTGSPQVGKIVMAAAAQHLSSVTLELGGKSPAIIDRGVNLKRVAQKTAWGKFLNNGQSCISPDYVMMHKEDQAVFVEAFTKQIKQFFQSQTNDIQQDASYGRIVNQKNTKRIQQLIQDAVSKGAKIAYGGQIDVEDRYVEPTVITDVNLDMQIMQEEIFGPVLPIMNYENLEDCLGIIEKMPYPLSAYLQSNNRKSKQWFMDKIQAGGMVINDYMLGFTNPNLPFGGLNTSGVGRSFGHQGFVEFSNEKGVIQRQFSNLDFLFPPYGERVMRILKLLGRWA